MPSNKGGNGKPGGGGGGEEGPLYLSGNKKDNVLTGGAFDDWINGKEGNDTLHGGDGNDTLLGADGNDILYGDAGNDELGGGDGDDELYGGVGNDVLHGGLGADIMDGGDTPGDPEEHDIASFVEVHNLDPVTGWPSDIGLVIQAYTNADNLFDYETDHGDRIVNVEEIQGTNYNDIMFGRDDMDDYFVGARGNDIIIGGVSADTLYGSLDDDTIYVGGYNGDIADIQAGMLDETMSIADNAVDTLIFLRVADRYFLPNGDLDFEYVFGDGVDTIYGFDPTKDKIHFISDIVDSMGNEIPDFDAELLATQDGDDTVIAYAPGSEIILVDVLASEINASHFTYEFMDV